jgi:hypothetical protein
MYSGFARPLLNRRKAYGLILALVYRRKIGADLSTTRVASDTPTLALREKIQDQVSKYPRRRLLGLINHDSHRGQGLGGYMLFAASHNLTRHRLLLYSYCVQIVELGMVFGSVHRTVDPVGFRSNTTYNFTPTL